MEFIGNFGKRRRRLSDWRASRSERFASEKKEETFTPKYNVGWTPDPV
jgi:hypothetical protein